VRSYFRLFVAIFKASSLLKAGSFKKDFPLSGLGHSGRERKSEMLRQFAIARVKNR